MLEQLEVKELFNGLSSVRGVIIDVRSEGEFSEAHVPGAVNIPLFSDLERVQVGTLYKQEGPEQARARGLEIVALKLPQFWAAFENLFKAQLNKPPEELLQKAFEQVSEHLVVEDPSHESLGAVRFQPLRDSSTLLLQSPLVTEQVLIFYCWRGGARSKSMALLAHLLGFNVHYVVGGHKAFRQHVLEFLGGADYPFKLCTLYGLTGSAKTQILRQWLKEGKPVIDLEALAFHRGSAFGQVGIDQRGRQKDFENNLFWEMQKLARRGEKLVVVEGESQRIGYCRLPDRFMQAMSEGYHIRVEKSLEERVEHILANYVGPFDETRMRVEARRALDAIKKKLGGDKHKELSMLLQEKNYADFTRELLVNYYDKMYLRSRAPEGFYHGVIGSAGDWEKLADAISPAAQ